MKKINFYLFYFKNPKNNKDKIEIFKFNKKTKIMSFYM